MKNKCLLVLLLSLFVFNSVSSQNSDMDTLPTFLRAIPSALDVKNLVITPDIVVDYQKDQVYVERDGLNLHLQVLSPRIDETLPCIVFVQGSAWMKQDVYRSIPQLSKFAARGYVIVSVEYRHTGIAPFPAQVQDVKTAIRYVRKNAEKLNIDTDNVFVWGDSSGGHTAIFAGITSGNQDFATGDYSEYSDEVNAVVDFYGPTDIGRMNEDPSIYNHSNEDSPEGLLIGKLDVIENMEKANIASPIYYIQMEKEIPPFLIAHGDMDRIVPFKQSDILADVLSKNGKVFEFYSLKDADHGTSEFWSDEMYDIIDTFLMKNRK